MEENSRSISNKMTLKEERIKKLIKLVTKGKLSPKLKTSTKKLIIALKKGDRNNIDKYSYLHQDISSGWKLKGYPYNEDDKYNQKIAGTTAYHEFDMIWHGDY